MATPFDNLFSFPINFDLSNISKPETKICIISIFGKSRLNPFCSKATLLNPVVDKDIFQGTEGLLRRQIEDGNIECYFDSDTRVMYLHLLSCYDANTLAQKCQQLDEKTADPQDFYRICQDEDLKHAQTLLLLFTLSHIVLLFHPGSTFDLTYLKLFRALDTIRSKLQPSMGDVLATVPGVSKEWAKFGRVCTPRMLFIFESPAIDVQPEEIETGAGKISKKHPPMKKLQMCIEDMIFRILRKTRAITNISNNSLFSVPINQQYVYLYAKRCDVSDPVDFLMTQTRQTCFPLQEDSLSVNQKPKSYSANRRKVNAFVPEPLPLSAPSTLLTTSPSPSSRFSSSTTSTSCRGQEQCLKEFLWQHVEMVFSKSINDNVGRHGIEPIFELPSLVTWLQAANAMHNFFFSDSYDMMTSQPFSSLKNSLDISMRFSENRCNKVLPLAESAYQQDLPPFYITTYHHNRLAKAQRVFAQYARGPAYDRYLAELEASCERFWKAGRQQCEQVSLTGNLCTNKVHCLPTDILIGPDDKRPIMEHSSQIKTKAACNCGRVQADKDDPFNHKYANFDFYQELETNCCSRLEHTPLPVFAPTTPDARAASIPSPPLSSSSSQPQTQQLQQQQDTPENVMKELEKPDAFSTLSDLSLALSLGQTGTAVELEPKESQMEEARDSTQTQEGEAVIEDDADVKSVKGTSPDERVIARSPPLRQHSTTEYLPYMIHSKTRTGLLPTFQSFNLCRLGSSGVYSHMMGLELPGFLPGSNFLLPWDISVKSEQQEKWPTVSETFGGGKKRQQRKLSKAAIEGGDTMTTVRVYLGMEYECPRGHRFFCSGPDKVIKVSSNSIVKDNASRLVHMDMPLYTSCHCKQPKGCMSQMMRVYIVTPRDVSNCPPVRVQINPMIQPAPSPCPVFHPGLDSPLELPQDGVWVLRLPHIYQDEHQVHLMPNDHQLVHNCYLQKGMFTYRLL